MTMKVYQREIEDGVSDLVKSTASVAYCGEAILHQSSVNTAKDVINNQEVLDKVLAENKDQIDLYYIESVLVSTGWNKNDDVFTTESTWEARDTPEDKQFNFMHNENDIIGHITGSYVLTKDGKAVADGDSMPEDFDIITQAVLYNSWTGEDNRERMGNIIAEIQDGKWYVSMECLFAGFDYALIDAEGKAKVLARDEASAFLTKHLRAYGGTGEYEGYKIGRALSNISFSGKGLVSKPANPRSVILTNKSTANFNVTDENFKLSIGDLNMSDQSLLEKQLADVQTQLSEAQVENEAIKAKIEEAKDKEFAATIDAYEATAEESKAKIDELNETIKSTQARVAELQDSLDQSTDNLAKAREEMEEMVRKEKMEKRKAALVELGLEEAEVASTLAAFDSLDDEAFTAVEALMKKKANKWKGYNGKDKEDKGDKEEKQEKEAKAEEEADEAVAEITEEAFEDVQSSEAALVEAEGVDELDKARAEVSDWFSNHVFNK